MCVSYDQLSVEYGKNLEQLVDADCPRIRFDVRYSRLANAEAPGKIRLSQTS